jgi:UDP-N-acetylglucosamine--N-acetylmuramyl-(pentapeptide) pyrophosphoryl-undecaprenol N-acetylglucosamine transferase
MKKRRIVLAGWGTGWHVFPIQSMLIHLDNHYADRIDAVYRYGSRHGLEHTIFQQTPLHHISASFIHSIAGKFRRETRIISWLKNIRDVFLFLWGILSVFGFLRRSRPDVVFCKGWFVALPLIIAAAVRRIPIVVHESDTKAWLTNRIAGWFACKMFVAFPWALSQAELVGQILSDAIVPSTATPDNQMIQEIISIYDKKKTYVIVTGGSQWSQRLYQLLADVLTYNPQLNKSYVFLVVGWFHKDNQSFTFPDKANIHRLWFCSQQDMASLLSIADMSMTRAGTTSLAEQQLFNIKKIIVPISWTHDQYTNAARYQKKYQDIVIDTQQVGAIETLDLTLQQHKGFKKQPYDTAVFSSIGTIKDTIAQSFFS